MLPLSRYQPLVQLLCREVKLGHQVRSSRGKVGDLWIGGVSFLS